MPKGDKYNALKNYLMNSEANSVVLTYHELEEILGFRLPKSAFVHRAWWGNHEGNCQAAAWMQAGFRITDVRGDGVTLEKTRLFARRKKRPSPGNLMFTLDRKDYDPSWPVLERKSAKAIILREGNVLMIRSAKYGEYKFPGGGLRDGELFRDALRREVLEETGYTVDPTTIREYGRTLELRHDLIQGRNRIFQHEAVYFTCEVKPGPPEELRLDGYESEYGYTAGFVPIDTAIDANTPIAAVGDPPWAERDLQVMRRVAGRMDREHLLEYWLAYASEQREEYMDDVVFLITQIGKRIWNILEVGCGCGRMSIPLVYAGHTVDGFDCDGAALARLALRGRGIPGLRWFQADAISNDWGTGYDLVLLAGDLLMDIRTDLDYREAQKLLIRKAATCVKPGGRMYLDYDCRFQRARQSSEKGETILYEGADDRGAYGRIIHIPGTVDELSRLERSALRYELTAANGTPYTVTREMVRYCPTADELQSWLVSSGWQVFQCFGDHRGHPPRPDSPRAVYLCTLTRYPAGKS